jgi:Fur family ferric uptake transcriptional regulator
LAADRPLSAVELQDDARAHLPVLGLATVYRAIRVLLNEGWLCAIELPGRVVRYEVANKGHHDHFVCRACDRVFEIEGCIASGQPILPPGFEAEGHEATVYGRCSACVANDDSAPIKNENR